MTSKRDLIQGTMERRFVAITTDFEFRATEDNKLHFEGFPSLFNVKYEMYGGPEKGGWNEHVNPAAFKRTLAAKPDVVLNMNHGQAGTGLPIARTTSGTLSLRTTDKGLFAESDLDLRDPDVQALQVKQERGDLTQMSFAFRTIADLWSDEGADRELMELSLDRGDVSIVTNGANSKTSFGLRGWDEALAALTEMDPEEALAELRAAGDETLDQMVRAHTNLGQLIASAKPAPTKGPMSVAQARRIAVLDTH